MKRSCVLAKKSLMKGLLKDSKIEFTNAQLMLIRESRSYVEIMQAVSTKLWFILDHFLKNIETFNNLKDNLNKVREKVTVIDNSITEVDKSITKSTENVIELKEQFESVLEASQVIKGIKHCFEYLEKAEIFVERGNLPHGEELLCKLKDSLDRISDFITSNIEEFLREKI